MQPLPSPRAACLPAGKADFARSLHQALSPEWAALVRWLARHAGAGDKDAAGALPNLLEEGEPHAH